MSNIPWDADRASANSPTSPPNVLAEIAGRRWDLHAEIAANPAAHPELVRWMATVNPAMAQPAQPAWPSAPPPPPKRSGVGWWFAGCGCLVLAIIMVVVIVIAVNIGNSLQPSGGQPPTVSDTASDPEVQEQLALFEQEQARIAELSIALEGNPAAPLVADFEWYDRQVETMADPNLQAYTAQATVSQITQFRIDLEASVAAAESRRSNATGSLSEALVDYAGNGFIDIQWDAASVCVSDQEEGWMTTGCVKGADSLTVHLISEAELGSEWSVKMTVMHELAHVYQRADDARFPNSVGLYQDLFAQGYFQDSVEFMADCYALTYYNEWTLSDDGTELGYGAVCDEAERQVIREWAADVGAPTSG